MSYVPSSVKEAAGNLREIISLSPEMFGTLSKESFLVAWASIAYLYPHLHPDDCTDTSLEFLFGWPRALRPFAMEALRRGNCGELQENEVYQLAANKAGQAALRSYKRTEKKKAFCSMVNEIGAAEGRCLG